MTLAEKIRQLRAEKGISQTKLAQDIHISRSAVAKWENGLGVPNAESMQLLADYFGVPVEELISEENNEDAVDIQTPKEPCAAKKNFFKEHKKAIIITSIICAGIFFEITCLIGFLLVNQHLDNVHEEAMRAEVEEYMMQDQVFESQYGQVLSVSFDEKYTKNGTYEYDLPCIVEVEGGKVYYVWVYLDDNVWTKITYKSISESKPDNWDDLVQ